MEGWQALSEKSQEASEALEEVGKLQRQCQGHSQQVQELERLLESAGEEVATARQLREAVVESERRAEVSQPLLGSSFRIASFKANGTMITSPGRLCAEFLH